jgi:phenylalanine-4-hydroxylase
MERQMSILPKRACREFLRGLNFFGLCEPGIPNFERLSERLMKATGWQVVAVPGLVPDDVFFDHLANRRFVSGNFIRRPDQLDYLQEPDVFHDVFGHVPLLADPVFADYMQAYGKAGQRANGCGALEKLARLYWYTVEFGLVMEDGAPRIFGAGIASSHSETIFSLESSSPNRVLFDLERLMRTQYRIDDYQQTYFIVESFEELLSCTQETDFRPLYERIDTMPVIAPDECIATDAMVDIGTLHHALIKSI